MTFLTWFADILRLAFANLFTQIGWIVLFGLGFRYIGRSIKEVAKDVPKWIDQYQNKQIERIAIQRAKLGLQQ